ncbi:MAG TPA: adenosylcobinamide-GDP ribazoletransferase [Candidatus Acidoferrales bacterium]|nr:adenosylcobinamide-GDP ribazoletransferase [Candidatus Acidoferrales bacterium]
MKALRDLAASFSYFSVFPAPYAENDGGPSTGAVAWVPLVGLAIGALSGLGAYGVARLTHAPVAAAITAWVLSIALSGAIHVDGFLDCCDGLFAMVSPQRRLEIMRDPHHGTYAIVGMAIISVLWVYALANIPAWALPYAVAAAAFAARLGAVAMRPSARLPIAVWVVFFLIATAIGRNYAPALGAGFVATWLVPAAVLFFARRRLDGTLNGDCYGAAIVVSEIALLMISAVSTSLGPGLLR